MKADGKYPLDETIFGKVDGKYLLEEIVFGKADGKYLLDETIFRKEEKMIKIGIIGVGAALLATLIKKERAEYAMIIGIVAGIVIFLYVLTQISVVIGFVSELIEMVAIEGTYYLQLLKMLGVAYVSEFASSICKDAGYQSIAGMVELFAKLSIVVLSIPGILFLLETVEVFL